MPGICRIGARVSGVHDNEWGPSGREPHPDYWTEIQFDDWRCGCFHIRESEEAL